MAINMIELIHLIRKRQADKLYIGQPFGSAIKYKRKELGLTLEEASEDICSVSYLSKVENNAINASDEFVDKFKERFNLVDAYDYDLDTYKFHLDQVIHACINDLTIDESLVTYYEDRVDYQSIIITYAFHVLQKDYHNSRKLYLQVVDMISSMPHESFIISMVLTNYIFFYHMNYSDGMQLLKITEKQQPYADEIKLLIKKWKLIYAFKLNNHYIINKSFKVYENELVEKHLFVQLQNIYLEKLIYEAKVRTPEDLKIELSKITSMNDSDKAYIITKSYHHRGLDEKALILSYKHHQDSSQWLILHLLVLDRMRMIEKIRPLLNQHVGNTDPHYKLISKHLAYKYLKDQDEVLLYIKNDVMTHKLFTDDYETLTYLMKDCEKILSSYQYYKDAVKIYRFFTRKINQMIHI